MIIKGTRHIHLGMKDGKNYRHTFHGLDFCENDGGRSKYFKGSAGDCVVRAISIASKLNYKSIYDDLYSLNVIYKSRKKTKLAKLMKKSNNDSPRNGSYKEVYHDYILSLGFKWTPTMSIGSGCKIHLRKDEIPNGNLIVKVSKHLVAVINGVMHDTFDPSRGATRCVYGYYERDN